MEKLEIGYQATERVTLGTAVMLPALRDPILLAHQLATLDRLSGGRLIAGTADEAATWLHGYVAAGARHLVIRLATDDHEPGLEEFAARVLPLLRKESSR